MRRPREAIEKHEAARVIFSALSEQYAEQLARAPNATGGRSLLRSTKKALATTLAWQADAHRFIGELIEAKRLREQELAIYQEMHVRDDKDKEASEAMLVTYRVLGSIALDSGDLTAATALFHQALDIGASLTKLDPDNGKWAQLDARSQLDLAEAKYFAGQGAEASQDLKAPAATARRLSLLAPEIETWQVQLLGRAKLLETQMLQPGSHETALKLSTELDGLATGFMKMFGDRKSIGDNFTVADFAAAAKLLRGDILLGSGDRNGAGEAWREGLSLVSGEDAIGLRARMLKGLFLYRLEPSRNPKLLFGELCDAGVRRPEIAALCKDERSSPR